MYSTRGAVSGLSQGQAATYYAPVRTRVGGRNIPCTPFQVLWPLVGLRNSRNGIWPLVGLRTRNGIWPRVGLRNRTLLIIQSVSSSVSSGGKRKPHRKPHRPGYRGSRVRGQRWLLTEVLDGTSVSSGGVWSSVCGAGRTLRNRTLLIIQSVSSSVQQRWQAKAPSQTPSARVPWFPG